MFVCCVCCVLSGGGLCDELVTRPEESYRLWRVFGSDQETSCDKLALGYMARDDDDDDDNINNNISIRG
jgi:hypothetical protein